MRVEQKRYDQKGGWQNIWQETGMANKAQLVLGFGSPKCITDQDNYDYIRKQYPNADVILTSTAGEIMSEAVFDNTLCSNAIFFEKTDIQVKSQSIGDTSESFSVGEKLAKELSKENLKHILVFSDGLKVNGSELIRGIRSNIDNNVILTGGLAGDGVDFGETYVGLNSTPGEEKIIVIVGLYGEAIQVGSGSVGGWDNFGVNRIVTKSKGNVVYTLDDKPILDLYKQYLGDIAQDLPGAGLLFPLTICGPDGDNSVVRTLLGIDEEQKSITFAGDVPQGYTAQLMRANFERLIDGASCAASHAKIHIGEMKEIDFALLISCVGRKLVLKQRIEEEIESVRLLIGPAPKIGGFYSYGEIAPAEQSMLDCKLHNQTMTITLFNES